MTIDPYKLLGVAYDATTAEIRRIYRSLAKKYHPDINKDEEAESIFKVINQAYAILSDPVKRSLYDEYGEEGLKPDFNPARQQPVPNYVSEEIVTEEEQFGDEYEPNDEYDVGETEVDSRSNHFYDDPHVHTTLEIDLATAIRGGDIRVSSPLGKAPLSVFIPPGVETGFKLKLSGHGRPGIYGGRPGDLIFEIYVRPHPFYHREGRDLFLELPISIDEALHGARIKIPTLEGWSEVPVPAGTRGGERLRLRGKGIVDQEGERGDLYVHLCIRLPERLESATRQLERLAGLYSGPVRKGFRL